MALHGDILLAYIIQIRWKIQKYMSNFIDAPKESMAVTVQVFLQDL